MEIIIIIKDGVLYHGNEAVADIAWRPGCVWPTREAEIEDGCLEVYENDAFARGYEIGHADGRVAADEE